MPEIRVNGVTLYYEEHGAGAPILCIHGTGSSAAVWGGAAAELAKHGRTIVYDRRGFSRSERPEPLVMDVRLHADDAAALLDALDAAPAVVIGRSQGGEVAVDLVLRHPDRVRALVLLEGGGLSLGESTRRWLGELDERVFAAAEADVGTVGETMLSGVLGADGWAALPGSVQEMFTDNGPAIVAEHRGGHLGATAEELGAVTHPTLLVGAKASPPELVEMTGLMAAAMPSARVEWVEGDHLIDPADPAVLAFVDEVLGRA